MRRKYLILATVAVCSTFLFTACSSKTDNLTETTETVGQTAVAGGSAIVVLDESGAASEIINDENGSDIVENTTATIEKSTSTETSEIVETESVSDTESISETEVEPKVVSETVSSELTIYTPNENADGFITEVMATVEAKDTAIFKSLVEKGVLTDTISVNSIKIENGICTLDLSNEFYELITNQGTSGEYMIMGSIINSYIASYDEVEQVQVLVNGEAFSTGHVEYNAPSGLYQ